MSIKMNFEKHYQKDACEVKLEVDLNTRNGENISQTCYQQPCKFNRCHEFLVNLNGNGNQIFGDLWFHVDHDDNYSLEYGITLYEVKSFSVDIELKLKRIGMDEYQVITFDEISNCVGKVSELTPNSVNKKVSPDASFSNYVDTVCFNSGIDSSSELVVTGKFTLKFDLSTSIVSKKNPKVDNFKSLLCDNAFESFDNKKNFTIICQGDKFHFNKTLLSMISEVFEKMIQDSDSKEARNNSVEIDDFSPSTIEKFQKVAFESENAKNEDLSPDLLLFAQKYLIMPLVEKCKKHLINSLTCENIFEIIKVAYLIDDDEMLKTASDFFSKNKNELKNTEELRDFKKSHPICMMKVFSYICGFEN